MRLRDLLKAKPRTISASPRSLYAKHHARIVEGVSEFLAAQGKLIIPKVISKYGKAEKTRIAGLLRKITPEEITAAISLNGWDSMVEAIIQPEIEMVFTDAGVYAATQTIAAGSAVESSIQIKLISERAVDYAKKESAQLVTQITESTRNMIRDAVSASINEGLANAGLADKLAPIFGNIRADLIASYELGQAAMSGNMAAWEASGVVKSKQWLTAGDLAVSDNCSLNAAQGAIPLDKEFQSGLMHPLSHPHCRCVVVAIVK